MPRLAPIAILMGMLLAAACGGAPTFSADQAGTAIAETVAAKSPPTDTAVPVETAAATPTTAPTSAPPTLRIAYTDGGNVAALSGAGPSTLLTTSGFVESIRLSDDGLKIAYTRRPVLDGPVELRVVNADGSGDSPLMSPADFDALYPLGGAVHHDLYQFDFLPGSHVLLLNTRSIFEGPGLATHDDLIRIDTDSLARTMLLAPGAGGDFTPSPDGRFLAIARPDTVEIRGADGSPSGSGVIGYAPVITYSEYAYYAQPVWSPDSTAIAVAIPSPDPFAPALTGSIWRMPVGGAASLVGTISGQFFFFGTGSEPLVAPDLARVAFTRATTAPNIVTLNIAAPDGTGEVLVATGDLTWAGWAPDASHFAFSLGSPMSLYLGDVSGASFPLITGTDLRWFAPSEFLFLSGSAGAWTLHRGGIGLPATPLVSPAGDFIAYDFAYP